MKININIPKIIHGAPDAADYRPIVDAGDAFMHALLGLLRPTDNNASENMPLENIEYSADQIQPLFYNNVLVAFMYIHSTDYHYLDGYYFMVTSNVRLLLGDTRPKKQKHTFSSPEAFIQYLTNIIKHQCKNDRVWIDKYERKVVNSNDSILKLTFQDKVIGIVYKSTETHYFISNEGINQGRERFFTEMKYGPCIALSVFLLAKKIAMGAKIRKSYCFVIIINLIYKQYIREYMTLSISEIISF